MKNFIIIIIPILFLINCKNLQEKNDTQNDRIEFVPEHDKDLRLNYEVNQKLEIKKIKN